MRRWVDDQEGRIVEHELLRRRMTEARAEATISVETARLAIARSERLVRRAREMTRRSIEQRRGRR